MSARPWVVIVTTEDGWQQCYGPFTEAKAEQVGSQLRRRSRAYTAKKSLADFGVAVEPILEWPGVRAATAGA